MPEIELVRDLISLVMLSTASYYDVKSRRVSDLVWLVFGGAGALLYLFEPSNHVTVLHIVIGVLIGIIGLATKIVGQADCLALIALTITMPTIDGLAVGMILPLVTTILVSIYSLSSNVAYNLSDLLHGRLYRGIHESPSRKIIAFILLHRKRGHEKFVFRAQRGAKFVFYLRPESSKFENNLEGHVMSAPPLIPAMLVAFVLVLAL